MESGQSRGSAFKTFYSGSSSLIQRLLFLFIGLLSWVLCLFCILSDFPCNGFGIKSQVFRRKKKIGAMRWNLNGSSHIFIYCLRVPYSKLNVHVKRSSILWSTLYVGDQRTLLGHEWSRCRVLILCLCCIIVFSLPPLLFSLSLSLPLSLCLLYSFILLKSRFLWTEAWTGFKGSYVMLGVTDVPRSGRNHSHVQSIRVVSRYNSLDRR
jgi:hypothetical protein